MTSVYRAPIAPRRLAPDSDLIGCNADHQDAAAWGIVTTEEMLRTLEVRNSAIFARTVESARVLAGGLTLSQVWRPSDGGIIGHCFWEPVHPAVILAAASRERDDALSLKPFFWDSDSAGLTREQRTGMWNRVLSTGCSTVMVIDEDAGRALFWMWVKLGQDVIATHERCWSVADGVGMEASRVEAFQAVNKARHEANQAAGFEE